MLNRYVPPDFDPSLVPRIKRVKNKLTEVRMMLPFSLRCNTCGEYMYQGKKFNSKKEDIVGETYMGIRKYRFYIKCSVCSAEITFKTDPKNSDYECEHGASRNFEIWRDTEQAMEGAKREREEEDEFDSMKALENRTLDSKNEIDVLDALDEIKAVNQRHERVDTAKILEKLSCKDQSSSNGMLGIDGAVTGPGANGNTLTEADEALIKSIKFGAKKAVVVPSMTNERSGSSRAGGHAVATARAAAATSLSIRTSLPAVSAVVLKKKRRREETVPTGNECCTSGRTNVGDIQHRSSTGNQEVVQTVQAVDINKGQVVLAGLLGSFSDDSD